MYKLLFFVLFVIYLEKTSGMSRQQLKKTMALMKNQCLSKIGVAESKIANIEQGVFNEERDVMCYMTCIYKNIQVMKNDKLNKELVMKQVDILYPQDMKAPVKDAVEKCMPVQDKYTDMCEGVFYAAKCLYETDPPNFIFP